MNPLGTFRRNDTLELFYEIIGADPFENHTTTLVVRKGGGIGANYHDRTRRPPARPRSP